MPKDPPRPLNRDLLSKLMAEASPPWKDYSLGKRLGVSDTTVGAWKKRSEPNGGVLINLCRLLGVTPWELYGLQPTRAEALAMRIDRLPPAAKARVFQTAETWIEGALATAESEEPVQPEDSEKESTSLLPGLADPNAPEVSPSKRGRSATRRRRS